MKNHSFNAIVLAGIVALAIAVAVIIVAFGNARPASGSTFTQTYLSFSQASTTVATVTTSSSLILASSTDATQRYYATLTNDSTGNLIYISLGKPAVTGTGIRLNPGQSYTINENNLFTGAVYGIGTTSVPVDIEAFQN